MHLLVYILSSLIPSFFASIPISKKVSQLPWFSSLPFNFTQNSQKKNWMSTIVPTTNISSLAIPGTHDSCTYRFLNPRKRATNEELIEFFFKTQTWSLYEQLAAGIRYIDIRAGTDGHIYHSVIKTIYTLDSVFQNVSSFLSNNPTESVIMRIQKNDKLRCKGEECIKNNIYSVLDEYKEILHLSPEVPLLKDIIGKVFIILEDLDYDNAMNWNSSLIVLQDEFRMVGESNRQVKKKQQSISEYLSKGKEKKHFIINHCSGTGVPLLSLKTIAMNENEVPYNDNGYSGIIIMDFPGEELIQHIINQNKEYEKVYINEDAQAIEKQTEIRYNLRREKKS